MKRPKMIGANVPKPAKKRCRVNLRDAAQEFSRAFDNKFCAGRPHMAWQQPGTQGEQ